MSEITLYLGDCLEILPTLAAQSVEAIITDLPYGTTACKWDEVIPFEPMWAQVKRLLKPRGVFVTTASQPFTSKLVCSNLGMFRYEWVWHKSVAGDCMNAKNKPMKQHENILVFSEGTTANGSSNRMNYSPQGLRETNKKRSGTDYGKTGGTFKVPRPSHGPYTQKVTGYPVSVLRISGDREKLHPTQKPVALYEYLIRTYTNEGDTVLDFCAGSGTTGVAAINTGRNAILIEKDAGYFEIMQRRITEAQTQLRFDA